MNKNEDPLDSLATEILTELIRRKCGFNPTAVMNKALEKRGITDESFIRTAQVIFGRRANQGKVRFLEAKAEADRAIDEILEMRRKRLQEEA